ncbi:DUF4145 domain-containing protein [Deinococcus rubellus]
MATMHCPFCHVHTSITPKLIQNLPYAVHDRMNVSWYIGECNNCGNLVLASQYGKVYPDPLPSPTPTEIPEAIRSNLVEAKQCASVGAWRAAVTMCRRAVQMACIDRGAPTNTNIVGQINYLRDDHIITNEVHEWATVVRWVGNDGAHPGGSEPDQEDASAMIDLAEQFLHVLYVAPAKAAAHRAKIGK